MGMTIDKAINAMEYYNQYDNATQHQARKTAIDTMSKYQKIEQIVKVWHQDIYAKDFECMAEIAEVVEDGNDDYKI